MLLQSALSDPLAITSTDLETLVGFVQSADLLSLSRAIYQIQYQNENAKLAAQGLLLSPVEELFLHYGLSYKKITFCNDVDLEEWQRLFKELQAASVKLEQITSSILLERLLLLPKKERNLFFYCFDSGMLSLEFAEKQVEAILATSKGQVSLPENVVYNISLLKADGINCYTREDNDPVILLEDPLVLAERVDLLRLYQRCLKDQDGVNYSYLKDDRMFSLLDFCIEQNIPPRAIDYCQIPFRDIETIKKRLYLAKMIRFPYLDNRGYLSDAVLYGKKFLVSKERLDEYYIDAAGTFLDVEDYCKLEEQQDYRIDLKVLTSDAVCQFERQYLGEDGHYHLGSVTLSRPRVLRNLTTLSAKGDVFKEQLFPALLYGSFLTLSEVEVVQQSIHKCYSSTKVNKYTRIIM